MLRANQSNIDRALRIFLGLFLLLTSMLLFGLWQWMVGVTSMFLLVTGLTGFCPFYRLTGITTL